MEFRTNLGILVARAIKSCGFTHEEIAKRAGTSRTRVTGVANQGLSGVSSDLMIRVLAATGHAVNPQLRSFTPRRKCGNALASPSLEDHAGAAALEGNHRC